MRIRVGLRAIRVHMSSVHVYTRASEAMRRINLSVEDSVGDWLDSHCTELRGIAAVARDALYIVKGDPTEPLRRRYGQGTLTAYLVGAGDKGTEVPQPDPNGLAVQTSSEKISKTSVSSSGEGVGRESEGTPRKPLLKQVPDELAQHHVLINEFWRVKKGAKSQTAWNLLITELKKIQAAYDDDRLDEQLQLAVNGLWTGISLRNMQRFETPKEKAAKEEPKHPASRVFTAADGFTEAW